jgi:hypothetical protein
MRNIFLIVAVLTLALVGCERVSHDDLTAQVTQSTAGNVIVTVTGVEAAWDNKSTRGLVDISEVCSRLCFAVYQNGSRVKYENQKAGDNDFGTMALTLDAGTYELLVLGHNGAANPATTNPEKIQFTNPQSSSGTGFTDTFYYYGTMEVDANGVKVNIGMKRATAMFRLMTTDVKPTKVKRWQFYYTGGSGALNAKTGYGCVKSQQSVFVDTGDDLNGQPLTFEMFTFLHQESDVVDFTVKAFAADNSILYEREFAKVMMQRNCITQYKGDFFTTGSNEQKDEPQTPETPETPSNVIQVDPAWGETFEFTY